MRTRTSEPIPSYNTVVLLAGQPSTTDFGIRPNNRFVDGPQYGSSCTHFKSSGIFSVDPVPCASQKTNTLVIGGATYEQLILSSIPSHSLSIDWEKLPTSNKFGIIQFFAELDDTLLMFTKKFWKQLSYGAFTWGVLPFVSEVQALLEQIENLKNGFPKDCYYEDSRSYDDSVEWISDGFSTRHVDCTQTYRLTGTVYYPSLSELGIPALYDIIGFQPSLSTAWDLVPLSFVVDWVIPIGSFLDSLKTSHGWIQYLYFGGYSTRKVEGQFYTKFCGSSAKSRVLDFTYFQRAPINDVLPVGVVEQPTDWLKFPSFSQLFNILYIFKLGKLGL